LALAVADILETHTRRFIAGSLSEIEAELGGKNERISLIVREGANRCKRILLRQITGIEVESRHE